MIIYDQRVRLKESRGYEATDEDVFRELGQKVYKAFKKKMINISDSHINLRDDIFDLIEELAERLKNK